MPHTRQNVWPMPDRVMREAFLVERERELAAVQAAIDEAASGAGAIGAGKTKAVVVRVGRKGLSLLRKKKKVAAKATVKARDTAGNTAVRTVALKLVAAKR
jgi:hypothetical protein